jgi:hypothetical protein
VLESDLGQFGKPNKDANSPLSPPHPNILNILQEAAQEKGDELLERYKSQKPDDSRQGRDRDLCKPYQLATDYALKAYQELKITAFTNEMSRIRKHVEEAFRSFQEAMGRASFNSQAKQASPTKRSRAARKKKKSDQEDVTLACARAYAEPVEGILLTRDVEQVKASYAYQLSQKFAFAVAFRELCHIKALASPGGIVPSIRIFDEGRTFSASFLRSLALCDEDLVA